jgi:hypothetical protein
MQALRFGTSCPVCGGPLVRGEGRAGCVLCGYAVQTSPHRRSTAGRQRTDRGRARPRQLMLPLHSLLMTAVGHEAQLPSPRSSDSDSLPGEQRGIDNSARHEPDQGANSPPPLVAADEIYPGADETAKQRRADHNAGDQNRSRAA